MRAFVLFGAVAVAALAGCSAGQKEADAVATSEGELKASTIQYLGNISDGQTRSASYSGSPKYQAFGFTAKGGDQITADVKSISGDAMGWITDNKWLALAQNDDASSSTLNSRVTYTVPAGAPSRSYRIVFRDYDFQSASFSVSLAINSGAPACDPSDEPWRIYKGTPFTCPTIRYTCPSGMSSFENDCGCGCE